MKIILNNKMELPIKSVIQNYNKEIDILFAESVTYETARKLYDPYNNPDYDVTILERFDIFDDYDMLQGTHFGYVEPMNITCFNGELKVSLKKEEAHERITKLTHTDVATTVGDNLINMDLLISIDDKLNQLLLATPTNH